MDYHLLSWQPVNKHMKIKNKNINTKINAVTLHNQSDFLRSTVRILKFTKNVNIIKWETDTPYNLKLGDNVFKIFIWGGIS